VDIDPAELKKPTVVPDVPVYADAKLFIRQLITDLAGLSLPDWSGWHQWTMDRKARYSAYLPEYQSLHNLVHPYHFINELSALLREYDIVVTANATPSIVYHQLGIVKPGQRVLWNSGCASMGYALPSAIGAAFASGKTRNVICLEGDGSLQMNIQELQTIKHHHLPIKLFILDNRCYISIKQTQTSMFNRNFVGTDAVSGVSFPDFAKIAEAYGIPVTVIDSHDLLGEKIAHVLNSEGPMVCHVKITDEYIFAPKTSSERKPDGRIVSKPLEDMFPFLDRAEFLENMIVKPLEE
jgi:acetolactate synthase-1/2/3 large subunit